MQIVGTRTWWLKQGALAVTILGAFLVIAGGYGLLQRPGTRAVLVGGAGLVVVTVGGLAWRRLARKDSVERLEQQIYGPEP